MILNKSIKIIINLQTKIKKVIILRIYLKIPKFRIWLKFKKLNWIKMQAQTCLNAQKVKNKAK